MGGRSSHRAGGRATCPGGQVSKGRGGRRALWEAKPEVGSRGERDSGRTRAGAGHPAGKGEAGSAPRAEGGPLVRGRPRGGWMEGGPSGLVGLRGVVSLGTPRSPHPRAAAGRAGSGPVSLPLRLLLAAAEGGKMAPAPASPLKGPETPAGKSHRTGPAPPRTAHNNLNQLQPPPPLPPPSSLGLPGNPRPLVAPATIDHAPSSARARVTRATTHPLAIP